MLSGHMHKYHATNSRQQGNKQCVQAGVEIVLSIKWWTVWW